MPVAAVEPGGRLGRSLRVADRQGRELQAGGPALGALTEHGRRGGVDWHVTDGGQQRGGLLDGEAQLGGPQLDQLAAGA